MAFWILNYQSFIFFPLKFQQVFIDVFLQFKVTNWTNEFVFWRSNCPDNRITVFACRRHVGYCSCCQRQDKKAWHPSHPWHLKGTAVLKFLLPVGTFSVRTNWFLTLSKCIPTLYCYHFIHTASASDRRTCSLRDISMG